MGWQYNMAMSSAPWLGGFALAGAAVLYDLLLAAVRRADRAYPSTDPVESTWWFGYSRDATNLAGVLSYSAGFAILGLRAQLALIAGFGLGLATYGLDFVLARRVRLMRPSVALAALAVPLAVLCALFGDQLAAGLDALVGFLFSAPLARTGRG